MFGEGRDWRDFIWDKSAQLGGKYLRANRTSRHNHWTDYKQLVGRGLVLFILNLDWHVEGSQQAIIELNKAWDKLHLK